MRPVVLLLWLFLAFFAQCLVAFFGVVARSLQTNAVPPIPALRLLLVISMLAIGTLMLIDVLTLAARGGRHLVQRQRRRAARQQKQLPTSEDEGVEVRVEAEAAGDEGKATAAWGGKPPAQASADVEAGASEASETQEAVEREQARPDLPLQRGLSRRVQAWEDRNPRLHRFLAAALMAVSMALAGGSQLIAPGYVDAAIVQLVNSFGVILVALIQSLLLRHKLPWLIWPCSAAMVGGACMVIVPTIGRSASGALDSGKAWLGFGLSLVACVSAAVMYIALQAFRRLAFSGRELQYYYLGLTLVVSLPLSLALDGTDWSEQFSPWSAGNWAMLILGGTLVYVSQNYLLAHTTWRLGAPVVSLFFGVRLVASIVESKIVLGATVVTSGVQIAGAVITVLAVTIYMWHTWKLSRAAAAAKLSAEAEATDAVTPKSSSSSSTEVAAGEQPISGK